MAPPAGVRARVRPQTFREETVEGFCDAFNHPHELVVRGKRDRTLGHKVAYGRRSIAETKRKHRRGAPCGAFWREGDATRGLPGRLGSKGDSGLALKPPIAEVDGGERLDGRMGQRQLFSQCADQI